MSPLEERLIRIVGIWHNRGWSLHPARWLSWRCDKALSVGLISLDQWLWCGVVRVGMAVELLECFAILSFLSFLGAEDVSWGLLFIFDSRGVAPESVVRAILITLNVLHRVRLAAFVLRKDFLSRLFLRNLF